MALFNQKGTPHCSLIKNNWSTYIPLQEINQLSRNSKISFFQTGNLFLMRFTGIQNKGFSHLTLEI